MEPRSSLTPSAEETSSTNRASLRNRLDLIVTDRRWRAAVPGLEQRVMRCIEASRPWLDRDRVPAFLLADDRAVKQLNASFRDKNKPTNVLTFEENGAFGDGDIALAYETLHREAKAGNKRFSHHFAHLVVHGLLHLAGHDHHRPDEARLMEMTEARILSRLGIPNPWRLGGRRVA
ncbi:MULTISPECIES: rRNA maturation RNase YbeY [Asaia]|uniref:rRNA maturation RNase YbeY n=1 Tax=Asaia TaxID=91914 RepID=UPI002FC38916